jgi:hypothetical protein
MDTFLLKKYEFGNILRDCIFKPNTESLSRKLHSSLLFFTKWQTFQTLQKYVSALKGG